MPEGSAPVHRPDNGAGRVARPLFLACFVLLWAASARQGPTGDASSMTAVARSIALEGRLDLGYRSLGYTVEGIDGLHYAKFPLPWSLVEVPGQWVERTLSVSALPMDVKDLYTRLVRGVTPAAAGAVAIVLLFLALARTGLPARRALALSLAFHLATCALPYLTSHYSEVFQVLAVNLGLWALAGFVDRPGARASAWLGFACGLLCLAKIVLAPVALVLALVAWRSATRTRTPVLRLAAWALAAAAAPLAVLAAYNVVRFGVPVTADYGWFPIPPRIEHPTLERLYGLTLSSGRGLLWFAPLSVLAMAGVRSPGRPRSVLEPASAGAFVAMLLVYASFTVWHGSEQWGPRFLVPMVGPLAFMASGPFFRLWDRGLMAKLVPISLVLAGLAVNLGGLLVSHDDFFAAVPYRPYNEIHLDLEDRPTVPVESDNLYRTNFVPAFSPIAGHWWLAAHAILGGDPASDCPWRGVVADAGGTPPGAPPSPLRTPALVPRLDQWWWPGDDWDDGTSTIALALALVMGLALAGAWIEVARALEPGRPGREA